jgi:hypothetical protein
VLRCLAGYASLRKPRALPNESRGRRFQAVRIISGPPYRGRKDVHSVQTYSGMTLLRLRLTYR